MRHRADTMLMDMAGRQVMIGKVSFVGGELWGKSCNKFRSHASSKIQLKISLGIHRDGERSDRKFCLWCFRRPCCVWMYNICDRRRATSTSQSSMSLSHKRRISEIFCAVYEEDPNSERNFALIASELMFTRGRKVGCRHFEHKVISKESRVDFRLVGGAQISYLKESSRVDDNREKKN